MQDDVSVSPAAVCSDTRITIADVIDTGFHSGLSKYPACGAVLTHVTVHLSAGDGCTRLTGLCFFDML